MKNLSIVLFLILSFRLFAAGPEPDWTTKVGARSFPKTKTTVVVTGAAKDGSTLATHAIQSAIDALAAKGGGTVTFEPGTYLTGSLFLKEGVELHIDKGVELIGSQHFEDYPEIDTRIAGIEMKWPAALLNIIGVKNDAITGDVKVNARGKFCWDKYWAMRKEYDAKGLRWIVDYDAKRVRTTPDPKRRRRHHKWTEVRRRRFLDRTGPLLEVRNRRRHHRPQQ